MDYTLLPFIEKVKTNQKAFGNKVIDIASKLDTIPHNLMVVMNNESGLRADIKNPTSSASGLIQFMEATAKGLGTTTAELRKMSNVAQLDYVYKYLKPFAGKLKSASDVYLSIFYPLALYKDDNWEFPEWAVKANKIFDINKDGHLTKKEFRTYVNNKYAKYLPLPNEVAVIKNEIAKKQNFFVRNKKPLIITGVALTVLSIAGGAYYYNEKKKNRSATF